MRAYLLTGLAFCLLCLGSTTVEAAGRPRHFFGAGVNYLRTVGELKDDDDWDNDNLSYVGIYQYAPSPFARLAVELEHIPDVGPDEDDTIWQPQAYALIGSAIYAGVGIGMSYMDDEWADDPFYALRAGIDLELVPSLHLDIHANYRFQEIDEVDDLDSEDADQIMFGAAARLGF